MQMTTLGVRLFLLPCALAVGLSGHAAAQLPPPPAAAAAQPAAAPIQPTTPIDVPEGDGAPVITDGLFTAGEWDDARRVPLGEHVLLLVKQYRGVVYLGFRGSSPKVPNVASSDLYLAVPGGPTHQLHVSGQLGETVVPVTGEPKPLPFGLTPDWYANELRRDTKEAERLEKAGMNRQEIMKTTAFPSDGLEHAIRRTKLPGTRWLLRFETGFLIDGRPTGFVFPAGTSARSRDGWQMLTLK